MQKQAYLRPNTLGDWAIWIPRLQTRLVGAEHISDYKGIILIRTGAGLAIALPGALHGVRRDHEQMRVAARPQPINEQRMRGLQPHATRIQGNPKLTPQSISLAKPSG